jgi:hypothetical protein
MEYLISGRWNGNSPAAAHLVSAHAAATADGNQSTLKLDILHDVKSVVT